MESEPKVEQNACECGCNCGEGCKCDCECCREGKCQPAKPRETRHNSVYSPVKVNDTVGAVFLGILAILLLVFLVRANKRNRELLLEVVELRRQA